MEKKNISGTTREALVISNISDSTRTTGDLRFSMKRSRTDLDEEIHPSSIDVHRDSKSVQAQILLDCRVCGGSAHGFNFDQITCESCKAFFRRNALRPTVNSHSPLRSIFIWRSFSVRLTLSILWIVRDYG